MVSLVGAKSKVQQIAMRISRRKALTIGRPFTVKHSSVTLAFNLYNQQQRDSFLNIHRVSEKKTSNKTANNMSGCFFLKHGVHSTAKPKLTAKGQSGHL